MTKLNTEVRYALEGLSQKQAFVLSEALELLSRLGIGQLEYLMEFVRFGGVTDRDGKPISPDLLQRGDQLMAELKPLLTGYPVNGSKGIGHPHRPENAGIAYELHKAIRHRLAWDRNPNGNQMRGVDFDDPYMLRYSDEPKAVLSQQNPEKPLHEQVPAGCFLGQHGNLWTVVKADDPSQAWRVLSEAEDAATAIIKAKAKLAKGD